MFELREDSNYGMKSIIVMSLMVVLYKKYQLLLLFHRPKPAYILMVSSAPFSEAETKRNHNQWTQPQPHFNGEKTSQIQWAKCIHRDSVQGKPSCSLLVRGREIRNGCRPGLWSFTFILFYFIDFRMQP